MELRHLRYFLMVAREGTISGAAAALHVSQPSLSRQMQELERDLGVCLFDRGSRHITLTEPGMRLRRRAEEIVDLVGRTEDEFRLTADTLSGEVRIGGGETPAMGLLADVMAWFVDAYPLVRFSLFSGNAENVGERLDRDLDVVATYNLLYNAALLARRGIGVVVSLEGIVDTSEGSGLAFRPLEPAISADVFIAWKRYQSFSPTAEAFLGEIRSRWAV